MRKRICNTLSETEVELVGQAAQPGALSALADALVLACGGLALDEALRIAHDLIQSDHPGRVRRQALETEAARLRQQLVEVEEQLGGKAA